MPNMRTTAPVIRRAAQAAQPKAQRAHNNDITALSKHLNNVSNGRITYEATAQNHNNNMGSLTSHKNELNNTLNAANKMKEGLYETLKITNILSTLIKHVKINDIKNDIKAEINKCNKSMYNLERSEAKGYSTAPVRPVQVSPHDIVVQARAERATKKADIKADLAGPQKSALADQKYEAPKSHRQDVGN